MKKNLLPGLTAGVMMLCSVAVANATTYVYDFTYDGTSVTTTMSAVGNVLNIGDTVDATFNAINGYWSAPAGTGIWTPLGVSPSGYRTGDLSWTFTLNGTVVDSGSLIGAQSSLIHITQQSTTDTAINFDTYSWEYTLTGYTPQNPSDGSTVLSDGILFGYGDLLNGYGSTNATFQSGSSSVPEPATMLLLGFGLTGLIAVRRKKTA